MHSKIHHVLRLASEESPALFQDRWHEKLLKNDKEESAVLVSKGAHDHRKDPYYGRNKVAYEVAKVPTHLYYLQVHPVLTRFTLSLLLCFAALASAQVVNRIAVQHSALQQHSPEHPHGEEMEERDNDALDENIYMFSAASLVRDLHRIAEGGGSVGVRSTRIFSGMTLLFMTVFVQITTLLCIKKYVTPHSVSNIREVYDQFEFIMYGSNESHTTLTVNGKHRGIEQYFNPDNFQGLDDDTKTEVCNIPLSQLFFFEVVLFIWSLTCMAQLRSCLESFLSLVISTPSVSSMKESLSSDEGEDAGDVIIGLTCTIKSLLITCVYLPWLWTTGYILWLGCRWLTATNSYGDLVLNAVALEFVLQLKELIYWAMVSERSKRDLRNTMCSPPWKRERASYWAFLNGLLWGYFAILWVWFYIFCFQAVLPDYKWDISDVCAPWLTELKAV